MRCELYIQFGDEDVPRAGTLEDPAGAKLLDFIDAFDELDFGVGQFLQSLEGLDVSPSEKAVDLMVIATAVFLADTSYSRNDYSLDGWTRRFLIHAPVSDPKVWGAVRDDLGSMLRFLTGDYWKFQFRPRPKAHKKIAGTSGKLDFSDFAPVTLFSGGLDSLIGAIDLLASGRKPLLISHYWDGEAASAQRELREQLEERFGEDAFANIRGRIGAAKADLDEAGSENSQRSRSFLFYSMAALAADALESTGEILIPENGLIALNVPMERTRLGSSSTRTAHPHFIASMNELAANTGIDVSFSNPYGFKTKGEMVSECLDGELLAELVHLSMSCSSPAKIRWAGEEPKHCGYCVPCLIRRAALAAGLDDDDPTEYYLDDLAANILDSKTAEGKDIRSFLFALKSLKRAPERARFLVRKPGPLPVDRLDDYADVYRRGMAEVAAILKGVRSRHG